jgi:hypothetical protein
MSPYCGLSQECYLLLCTIVVLLVISSNFQVLGFSWENACLQDVFGKFFIFSIMKLNPWLQG